MLKKDWSGKYATVIYSGEVVEVVSYDRHTIQVKNADGFSQQFKFDEVQRATAEEAAEFRKKSN